MATINTGVWQHWCMATINTICNIIYAYRITNLLHISREHHIDDIFTDDLLQLEGNKERLYFKVAKFAILNVKGKGVDILIHGVTYENNTNNQGTCLD